MISVCFQGKPFNITVIQVYTPTTNAEEAKGEWLYNDLKDLLDLTEKKKKKCPFIMGNWDAKVGSHKISGVTGNYGVGFKNEAGQRLTEFCQENALVLANTRYQQHKRRLCKWTSLDGQHGNQTDYILCCRRWISSI